MLGSLFGAESLSGSEASEAEISEIDSLSGASEPGVWARPAH